MVRYHLQIENPLNSFLQVKTIIQTEGKDILNLQLPAWRPGRYELQNFAQKLQSFQILDQKQNAVLFEKVTKDRWEVNTAGLNEITVLYNFYARQMDAGGSWADETQLYVNPINLFLQVQGQADAACEVYLDIPEIWQIAGGLPQTKKNTLSAPNYDVLVDSPFIASPTLQQIIYKVNNIPFYIWIQGNCQVNWDKIKHDFTAFTQEQLNLFGDFPVADYHFLNQILPYAHYHGVEHANSTVITLGPGELFMSPALYKEFIGVSSHELFHTWNIKKIRPQEMLPYDYARENYFRTGYIAEGVTTYYGDYLLARCGVFTAEQYFTELNGVLGKHFIDYGHENYSVADSSFDTWLDGYKAGIPDRKVSIYHKGALAALILDLEIRRTTQNKSSLDTVMVRLWHEFGIKNIGYTETDYERLVAEITQTSFLNYFQNIIYGTAPLPAYLEAALHYVGCTLNTNLNPILSESKYGFKTTLKDNILQVSGLAPQSPAADVLSLEDELIAINGRRIEGNFATLLSQAETVELTLFRNKMLRQVTLKPDQQTYFPKYSVSKLPQASPEQRQNFAAWLKQVF